MTDNNKRYNKSNIGLLIFSPTMSRKFLPKSIPTTLQQNIIANITHLLGISFIFKIACSYFQAPINPANITSITSKKFNFFLIGKHCFNPSFCFYWLFTMPTSFCLNILPDISCPSWYRYLSFFEYKA